MRRISKNLAILVSVLVVVCLAVGSVGCSSTSSEEYPSKPITLVVPWGAGGSTDVTGRAIADVAEKTLGQPVVVKNREGGSSTIGTQEVANADGDGYTILVATINALAILPHTLDLQNTPADFKGVGRVAVRDIAVVTTSDKPWNDMADFIEDAKKNPGAYSFATPQGGLQHLVFEQVMQAAGFEATLYPVQGDAEGLTAVLGGTADLQVPGSYNVAKGQMDAGEMKALAVFSEVRAEALPDTPTLIELGYDVSVYPWTTLLLPATTPDDVVKQVQDAFKVVLNDPELIDLLERSGQTPMYLDGDAAMEAIQAEYERFGQTVEAVGLGK